jgi:hypothetical protein
MLQAGRSQVRFLLRSLDFSIYLIFPRWEVLEWLHNWQFLKKGSTPWVSECFELHYDPGVDSASNRNEHQESSWGVKGGRPARKADSLTAICEPIF